MKVTFISDTHGCHRQLDPPGGDLIIHAGDICNQGNKEHVSDFLIWYADLPYTHKLFIQGNHDRDLLNNNASLIPDKIPENITYLKNSSIIINNFKIWGTPFYEDDDDKGWALIPENVDILITHNPPHGILDETPQGTFKGSVNLKERIHQLQPKLHLFGHIHHSYGDKIIGNTHFINGSNYEAKSEQIKHPFYQFEI